MLLHRLHSIHLLLLGNSGIVQSFMHWLVVKAIACGPCKTFLLFHNLLRAV